jgi:DNA modification methylase
MAKGKNQKFDSMDKEFYHPVQALMSRTGSFPLHVAYSLLRKYTQPPAVVFDPFCGKGTSLLAARLLGSRKTSLLIHS